MSRLRLAAGSAMVKLAQEPCYHEIITLEQYQLCALAINVSSSARLPRLGRGQQGPRVSVPTVRFRDPAGTPTFPVTRCARVCSGAAVSRSHGLRA